MTTDLELPDTGPAELDTAPGTSTGAAEAQAVADPAAPACATPETHNWGCGCPPVGPGSARQVATYLASGANSHLVAGGQTECLSDLCPAVDVLAGVATL